MENKKELINQSADLIAKGDFQGAAGILEKIYTDDEKNTEIIKNLGLCYINIENYQKAAAAFKKALAQDPKDATALFYLANCNDKLGFEDKAIEEYKKVIELREEFFEAYKNLAVIYMKQGNHEKIISLIKPVLDNKTDDYLLYYLIATAQIALEKHKDAVEYLKKAIELRPDHLQLQNNLASCYIALDELENASLILNSAYSLDSSYVMTNYNLGVLNQIKGDYKKALAYFNTAYQKEPSISLMTTLAYCARRAGELNLACDLYKSLVALYPDKANFQNNLLSILMDLKRYEEALKTVKDLLKFNPKSTDLMKKYAALLRLTGSSQGSIDVLETLIKRGKVDVEIYYNYALSLINLEDLEGAKEAFKKCIALEPHNPFVHKDLGLLYLRMNFVDWAGDEFRQAI